VRAWLTPDSPAGALYGRPLFVPDAFIPIVWSHLDELAFEENWEAYGTMSTADAAAAMAQMMEDFRLNTISPDTSPVQTIIPVWAKYTDTALVFNLDTAVFQNGYYNYQTPAINNKTTWRVSLPAGNYFVYTLTTRNSACGIAHFQMDGTDFATLDCYAAALTRGVAASASGTIDLATGGDHLFSVKMSTKNASSSNYQFFIQAMILWRNP